MSKIPMDNYYCTDCGSIWIQKTDLPPKCPTCPNRGSRIDENYGKPAFQQVEEAIAAGKTKLGEYRDPLRDYTSEERKGCPIVTGVLHYFPDAIMAVARVSVAGNLKHNPGEPLHWSRGKSNDHINCEGRHLLTPDGTDADTGQSERANKAWRALADLQIAEEKRLIAAGIKPLSGVTQ